MLSTIRNTPKHALVPPMVPELRASDDIRKIRDAFFMSDCVLLRGLLKPKKLEYFYKKCVEIYAKDDNEYHAGRRADDMWLREYQCGWIWEDRLRHETGGAFSYEDITFNKRLYDILQSIIGSDWQQTSASQIRRMAPVRDKNWGSTTTYHLDAQWGIDHLYIVNVWVPFTPCGHTAPGLEFLLTPAADIRAYSQYDPSIPLEPAGPGGVSPRMNYDLFEPAEIKKHYAAESFWAPSMNPGDVILFSNWCTHRTWITPDMDQTRISLEWRLRLDSFDTSLRPNPV
jgi:hypothetical protein